MHLVVISMKTMGIKLAGSIRRLREKLSQPTPTSPKIDTAQIGIFNIMEIEKLQNKLNLNDQQISDIHNWAKHIKTMKRYHNDHVLLLLNELAEHKTNRSKK